MKKQLRLLSIAFAGVVTMIACERKDQFHDHNLRPDFTERSFANNGMIKSYDNSVVLKWNEAVSLAVDNKMPPPPEARIYAMVMLAMHDALNNAVPKYKTYALDNRGVYFKDVSKKNIQKIADAAAAQAAHDVLVKLVPATAIQAATLLNECLSSIEESEYRTRGIQTGKDAAEAILEKRKNDPPLKFAAYPQGTEPGQYRSPMPYSVANPPAWPDNAAYAPDLGTFEPFGVKSSKQFRAIPPYSLGSSEYTADYNEVKSLGGNSSTTRTPEQAEMGVFFLDNVANSINRVLRILAVRQKLDGWETARLLALTHMAQFDAVQSSFEGKYHYNLWRPETAINNGETDGNDDTAGDVSWKILAAARATPPTPTYPSTHAEAAGAVAEILKLYFRRDNIPFTISSYALPDVERSFYSFSQFAREVSISRIYIGYHFRNDIVQGEKMGRKLAKFVFENNLKEL